MNYKIYYIEIKKEKGDEMNNKFFITKKRKGFSMIETLAVVSLSSLGLLTMQKIMSDEYNNNQSKILSQDINKILTGFDLRFNNDDFNKIKWDDYKSNDYSFQNKEQVSDFIGKALIAYNAPVCGKINGWKPTKKDGTENYKDKFNFIYCGMWNKKIPLGLNAKLKITNSDDYMTGVNLILFFDKIKDFKKKFKLLKQTMSLAKSTKSKGLTGVFDYHFVSITTEDKLSTKECIQAELDCGFEASFTGSNLEYNYLDVNGNNNMINSKIKFQKKYDGTAINTCFRYVKDGISWRKIDNVYCGIGIGKENPSNVSSSNIDYVELNTDSIQTNKIFLNKLCEFRDDLNNIIKAPCGIYKDETTSKIISNYDQVRASKALIDIIDTKEIRTENANVKEMNVSGDTKLQGGLDVLGNSSFNKNVTINGEKTDINLVVESSAKLSDVEISGDLIVHGKTNFLNEVNVDGNLNVNSTLSTKTLELQNTISSDKIGTSCKGIKDGSIANYSDYKRKYNDLAICSNGKWELLNSNKNQIIPFNGKCPSGYKKFDMATGRTLVGSGDIYDSSIGKTIHYNVGDKGGESFHKLTIAEMPSHNHKYVDAYFMEHWGNLGAKNMIGVHNPDYDNNYYTRNATTELSGGDAPHENRMPYYVINWCIYNG